VHLDVSGAGGGQWTLDLTDPEDCLSEGFRGTPTLKVTCADEDFVKIATGKADPKMAVITGKLQFEPMDLELVMEVARLFS
jgi:putative sterol carrier protein